MRHPILRYVCRPHVPFPVFKPRDEEPNAINNPKPAQQESHAAHVGEAGLKGGIRVGDAALNEAAAYILDSRAGHFSRVPPTVVARSEHHAFFDAASGEGTSYDEATRSPFRSLKTKVGSLQRFVSHDGCADDFSASLFTPLEVQRIAVLDIRMFNTDRHGANLLVQRQPRQPSPTLTTPTSSPPHSPRSRSCSSPTAFSALSGAASPLGGSAPARSMESSPLLLSPPSSPPPPPPTSLPATLRAGLILGGDGDGSSGSSAWSAPGGAPDAPVLIPIDHGFCLPAAITVPTFEWQYWPQVGTPPCSCAHACMHAPQPPPCACTGGRPLPARTMPPAYLLRHHTTTLPGQACSAPLHVADSRDAVSHSSPATWWLAIPLTHPPLTPPLTLTLALALAIP